MANRLALCVLLQGALLAAGLEDQQGACLESPGQASAAPSLIQTARSSTRQAKAREVPVAPVAAPVAQAEQHPPEAFAAPQVGAAAAGEAQSGFAARTWFEGTAESMQPAVGDISLRAAGAECLAMTLFVIIGCGSAMGIAKESGSAWVLQVSLTFGFAITSLAYAVGSISGGQINCAVTFALVLAGQLAIAQGLVNLVAQLLGSLLGAAILCVIYPPEKDLTGGLGSNAVGPGWTALNALVGEVVGTYLLVYVVLMTPTAATPVVAVVAIGFAVFLAHSVLVPIDGCSINPTRSFGPAIVAKMRYGKGMEFLKDLWIFWVGPLMGSALAALVVMSF